MQLHNSGSIFLDSVIGSISIEVSRRIILFSRVSLHREIRADFLDLVMYLQCEPSRWSHLDPVEFRDHANSFRLSHPFDIGVRIVDGLAYQLTPSIRSTLRRIIWETNSLR